MSQQNSGERKGLAPWNPNTSLTHPRTLAEAGDLAQVFVRSRFFKDAESMSQAIVKVMYGRELGLSPMVAMTSIDVVEGRPAPSAALILGLIEEHKGYDYEVEEVTPEGATIAFFRIVDGERHLRGTASFTMEDAKRAKLNGKKSWQTYPEDMCFNRAVTRGARRYCPGLFRGIPSYTPEELGAPPPSENSDPTQYASWPEEAAPGPGYDVNHPDNDDDASAADAIRNGEYRFLSPEFTFDWTDERVGYRQIAEYVQVIDTEDVADEEEVVIVDPDTGEVQAAEEEPEEPSEGSSPPEAQTPADDVDSNADAVPEGYPPPQDGWTAGRDAWERWCWLRENHGIDPRNPDPAEEAKLVDWMQDSGAAPNVEMLGKDSIWSRALKAAGLADDWANRLVDAQETIDVDQATGDGTS